MMGRLLVRLSRLRLSCDQRDDRYVQLLASAFSEREIMEISLVRVLSFDRRLHRLQIIDNDQPQFTLLPDPGRRDGRAPVGLSAGLSSMNILAPPDADCGGEPRPFVILQVAVAHAVLVDSAERGHHTHSQRLAPASPY